MGQAAIAFIVPTKIGAYLMYQFTVIDWTFTVTISEFVSRNSLTSSNTAVLKNYIAVNATIA
jgi:hypothetical protein